MAAPPVWTVPQSLHVLGTTDVLVLHVRMEEPGHLVRDGLTTVCGAPAQWPIRADQLLSLFGDLCGDCKRGDR